jgi:ABC-type sugar transport system ATPase subunit
VVHQEAPLIPTMTIADYVGLSIGFPVVAGAITTRRLNRMTAELLAGVEISIDPSRLAGTLSGAERAAVHLALALHSSAPPASLLILDEATAALPDRDAASFLARVRAAADDGVGVMMVTHRLNEVREWCDRVVVLRDGHIVHESRAHTASAEVLVRQIMGPSRGQATKPSDIPASAGGDAASGPKLNTTGGPGSSSPRLQVEDLAGSAIRSVSFTLSRGEIVGVSGRLDGGVSELLRLVSGITRPSSGIVRVDGRVVDVARHPLSAIQAGIVYLSANRLEEGGLPSLSVAENLTLPRAERYWMKRGQRHADVAWAIEILGITPSDPAASFGLLSGGNQQKVLLARWLLLKPKVLVLDDPTQGIDPGTRERMFALLSDLSKDGVSVVLHSTEPEQLARLSDRILIVQNGVVREELTGQRVTGREISVATFS